MIEKIRKHHLFIRYKKYFRFLFFCFVGATASLIHILTFNFFRFWINLDFVISLMLGVCLSIIYNFSMNRNITFSAKEQSLKKQIPRYMIVYATAISANFFTALFVKHLLGGGFFQENIALITGIAVSIPISFFGSLLWAFKKQ